MNACVCVGRCWCEVLCMCMLWGLAGTPIYAYVYAMGSCRHTHAHTLADTHTNNQVSLREIQTYHLCVCLCSRHTHTPCMCEHTHIPCIYVPYSWYTCMPCVCVSVLYWLCRSSYTHAHIHRHQVDDTWLRTYPFTYYNFVDGGERGHTHTHRSLCAKSARAYTHTQRSSCAYITVHISTTHVNNVRTNSHTHTHINSWFV